MTVGSNWRHLYIAMETNCNLTIVIQRMADLFLFVLWQGHKPYNHYALIKQMHFCIECWEDGRNILPYQWYSVTGIIRLACFQTGVAPHFSLTFTFCRYHAINTTVCCTKKCPKSGTIGKYGFMNKLNLSFITITTARNRQCSAFLTAAFFPGFSCAEFSSWKTVIDSLWNWIIAQQFLTVFIISLLNYQIAFISIFYWLLIIIFRFHLPFV
jgi:hypothetical protein